MRRSGKESLLVGSGKPFKDGTLRDVKVLTCFEDFKKAEEHVFLERKNNLGGTSLLVGQVSKPVRPSFLDLRITGPL